MTMKRLIPIILLLVFAACEKTPAPVSSRLVVEGWIDSGGHPVVLLSETLPLGDREVGLEELLDTPAKWAKVSVDDGSRSVLLTGTLNTDYYPPYVYTSTEITGEPGKTYNLRVEYKDYVATASTTIPEPVPLDTIYCKALTDTTCRIVCGFTDPEGPGDCYRIFSLTERTDRHYVPVVLGIASDEAFSGYMEMQVLGSWHLSRLEEFAYTPDIHPGDVVWIKFCTTDRNTFKFWESYETMASNDAQAVYTLDNGFQSQLQGAIGYWAGYGVHEYRVTVAP